MQFVGQAQKAEASVSSRLRQSPEDPQTAPPEPVKDCQEEFSVSFHSELPLPLQQAMVAFIERCPNWDQYRLIQAALAGFLIQHGVESREITRLYVGNMFQRESLSQGV